MVTPSEILAKSSLAKITLVQHTKNLLGQWRGPIKSAHIYAEKKYGELVKADLADRVIEAICWHDAGKQHRKWQAACRADYTEMLAWAARGKIGDKPRGRNLRDSGIRHEMDSLCRLKEKKPDVPLVILAAIAAHHRKLGRSEKFRGRWKDDDGGRFSQFWEDFCRFSNTIISTSSAAFEPAIRLRYEYAGPRALLQLADHRASATEEDQFVTDFASFRYSFPETWSKRGVQNKVELLWHEPLALLRAPTGAGKTDAALLWAKHQIESGKADRLVIAMPTRFTANALAIATTNTLSSHGLYHSSAWYQTRHENPEEAKAKGEMARLLETPVTITTLDHLCISLTGTREDHHATFFNLAHACVVIDEADFYDSFTQANLVVLLRALRTLKVPVLLMSATLPESSRELYTINGEVPAIYEDETENDRPRCQIYRHPNPIIDADDMESLLAHALSGEPTIIYVNTVQRAQRVYDWLARKRNSHKDLVFYHSRFTEPDKEKIEARLIGMLGKEAWANGKARGIAVLTQIGELSVNISADHMISELCPLDRLVQRIGRLSRFLIAGTQAYPIGKLTLIKPSKLNADGEPVLYPAPYGMFRNNIGWEPSPALIETERMLTEREAMHGLDTPYTAAEFVDMVNVLYRTPPVASPEATQNARKLERAIAENWLMLPTLEVEEDADETAGSDPWRCRDIAPQLTVLVGLDKQHAYVESSMDDDSIERRWLPNWTEWRKLKLEHGIPAYVYEVNAAENKGRVEKVTYRIGTDERSTTETAWIARPETYSSRLGLQIRDPFEE